MRNLHVAVRAARTDIGTGRVDSLRLRQFANISNAISEVLP